jgi:hypothetical protein
MPAHHRVWRVAGAAVRETAEDGRPGTPLTATDAAYGDEMATGVSA